MTDLKITTSKQQGVITFNYDEIKAEVSAAAAEYATAIYTPDTIADAKADRARLNKFKNALNDERIRREKEWLQPFNEFKAQINEIIKIVEGPIAAIDEQIKTVEGNEKEAKRNELIAFYDTLDHPAWLTFSKIENPKWQNKTCSLASAKDELEAAVLRVKSDLDTITNWSSNPSVSTLHYMENMNLGEAFEYARSLEKVAAPVANTAEVPDDEATWVSFKVLITPTQAKLLKTFLTNNKIEVRKGE